MAYIDSALAFDSEEHHHLAVHIEHHHTDGTFVVVGAESKLALGRVGINFSGESWLGMGFMDTHQQIFIIAERDTLPETRKTGLSGAAHSVQVTPSTQSGWLG